MATDLSSAEKLTTLQCVVNQNGTVVAWYDFRDSPVGLGVMGGGTTLGAALGGFLLGGPIGIIVGAAIGLGGTIGICQLQQGQAMPLPQLFDSMKSADQQSLADEYYKVVGERGLQHAFSSMPNVAAVELLCEALRRLNYAAAFARPAFHQGAE